MKKSELEIKVNHAVVGIFMSMLVWTRRRHSIMFPQELAGRIPKVSYAGQ